MVDLETLGTEKNAAVVTIAFVAFDGDTKGDEFYVAIRATDYDSRRARQAFSVSVSTLLWWTEQTQEVRDAALCPENAVSIETGFAMAHAWLEERVKANTEMWAQGSDFDFPVLEHGFSVMGLKVPWKFYQVRDARTLVKATGTFVPRGAGDHNALADCHKQIDALVRAYQRFSP